MPEAETFKRLMSRSVVKKRLSQLDQIAIEGFNLLDEIVGGAKLHQGQPLS